MDISSDPVSTTYILLGLKSFFVIFYNNLDVIFLLIVKDLSLLTDV